MIQDIEIAAANFRDAIEEISPSLESFETFPRGCCGIASLMLGTYLKELGFGEFQIVTGSYGSEAEGNMLPSMASVR